ncbi:peptidase M1, membrane alanine aminopeptidase [Piptocephalis cylindrospora]|uniref:Peptidase M1, membrane alanine aminopeptidase n=1 Tax=Piptocephalis cylindrospora TaxID=1907219 RepID=A0A4P9Y297_9FUNG|nr:peptidase M1, membrane alanine aminopeptidase [Piptocephalis cylindrospora]|eukprot:RKP12682.1 peptidase M1, membrane alanine aminopeptidase [Piptocephalis cylindrospora]
MAPPAPTTTADRTVLPTEVHPTHYDLTLTPDLKAFTFTGYEEIQLVVDREVRKIVLNADEIEIQKAKLIRLVGKTEETWDITDIDYDKPKQQVTLLLPDTLHPGADAKPKLQIHFTGILNDKMSGFYRSSYDDAKTGEKEWMAVTQFEAADARKAFPCWDEPSIKATFDITLRVPSRLTALSNMDVREERDEEGGKLKAVRFNTSPIMSTYLVAFTVGDLEFIEASTSGEHNEGKPVRCRIYTPPGLSSQGAYALSVTTRVLEYFAQIFGTPYPLPKMDMLAVPDFEAGAMENWGLVTYRTVLLLWEEGKASGGAQQRIASVVAHELAHQWFGNLVTMEWWSHLWLNEGFATWVGELACDHIHPEWDVWTRFVVDDVQRGLHLDSLRSSHPIEVEVRDAAEIGQIFDAISYSKGGSVIRMLSSLPVGDDCTEDSSTEIRVDC